MLSNLLRNIIKNAFTSWGPLKTTNQNEDSFVNGNVYSYEDYTTYSASEVKYLYFDCSSFTGTNLVVLPPAFSASAGPVTIEYYSNPTISAAGTELDVSNRRGTSLNVNESKLYSTPPANVTDPGTRFTGRVIVSTGTDAKTATGAPASGGLPFELNPIVNYLIKITNTDGDGVYIQTDFSWIEE